MTPAVPHAKLCVSRLSLAAEPRREMILASKHSLEPSLPAAHVFHLVQLTKRFGLTPDELLEGLDLRLDDLSDPEMMVRVPTVAKVAQRARLLTGEPGIGVLLGLQTYCSEHGYLGFAVMSAPTLREALDLILKYATIRTTAFAFDVRIEGSFASLRVEELADFGSARDIVLLALLIGLRHTGVALIGSEMESTYVELKLDEPSYYERFRHIRPRAYFGRPHNAVVFDASLLDVSLATADPASHRLALEQCRQLLDSIEASSSFGDRVQRLIVRSERGLRSLDDAAAALNVSARTLRRRLADERTTFAVIRDRACRERAIELLRSHELSIAQLAETLGYANVANFTRAFQRWTGQTPGAFRRSSRAPIHS